MVPVNPPFFRRHWNRPVGRPVRRAIIAGVVAIKFRADVDDIYVEDGMSLPEIPAMRGQRDALKFIRPAASVAVAQAISACVHQAS